MFERYEEAFRLLSAHADYEAHRAAVNAAATASPEHEDAHSILLAAAIEAAHRELDRARRERDS